MSLTQRNAVTTGKDIAVFYVHAASQYQTPICQSCNQEVLLAIKYSSRQGDGIENALAEKGIRMEHLVLKSTTRPLGITCGCYAKFQRQIGHISTIVPRSKKNDNIISRSDLP